MKTVLAQLDAFLKSVYVDSRLKNRIVLWTFLVLVLPAALLYSLGIPLKTLCIAVAALILPIEASVFSLYRTKKTAGPAIWMQPHMRTLWERQQQHSLRIVNVVMTSPELRWEDLLEKLKLQRVSVVYIGHSSGQNVEWKDALGGRLSSTPNELLTEQAEMQRRQSLPSGQLPSSVVARLPQGAALAFP